MRNKILNVVWPAAFGIALIIIWQAGLLHKLLKLKPFQLPVPSEIISTLSANWVKALTDCGVTISGALIGMLIGSLIGFGIAIIATFFPKWGYGGMIIITAPFRPRSNMA